MIAAALVAATLAGMYRRVLWELVAEWTSSPDTSYGVVLAVVAAYLLWQRRRMFCAAIDPAGPRTAPLAALTAGAALFVAGQLAADLFLTRLSLIATASAAAWFLVGSRAVRTIGAPIGFAAMAIPLPAILVNAVTLPLQLVASRLAESTLMLAGVPVFRDGNVLALPMATLQVAEACSGLRSLVSLVAIAIVLAWMSETTAVRRALLIALAAPVAIVMNGWRIAATGIACEFYGPRAASGAWHEVAGWITFAASVGVLGLVRPRFERARGRRVGASAAVAT